MPRFEVQRSIKIDAPPAIVFQAVSDFGTWTKWSPWLCAEPDAEVTVTDNSSQVGAIYAWKGDLVGEGEIEHRSLEPDRLIADEIRFTKPFRSRSDVNFHLEPAGTETEITWEMKGSLPWFLFWMRSTMEIMIGMDYERGLKMLKEWIETGEILTATQIRGVESVGPFRMAGIRKTCTVADVGPSMEAAFAEARQRFEAAGLPLDGKMVSVYHKFNMKAGTFDYTSGYGIPETVGESPAGLSVWSTSNVQALRVTHLGRYSHLGNAWNAAHLYARHKKLRLSKSADFEFYENASHQVPAAEIRTEIYLPIR